MTFYRSENESVMNIEEINPHLTAKIVSTYVRHQTVRPEQISDLITSVHQALGQLGRLIQPEAVRVRKEEMPMLPLVLSSDSHVFEPPDLWQTRIDAAFRDRAPRIERIDGTDQIVVEADQILSGIGLISNAGARFAAPETISAQGRFEDVHRGGYDPEQHLKDMALDGVAGEVLYPSQGLFYFKVADTPLMSAIFRAYNDWLAEFCRTVPPD